jgi:caa(3)-type oxidase subunit IV
MSEEHAEHSDSNYIKIWAILVGLLAVSVIGPMFEIQALTLFTAFGIAVIKAFLVLKHFMHLSLEPKFVSYMVTTVLVFMFLFYAGAAPDVMQEEGSNWVKPAWQADAEAYQKAVASGHAGGEHH